jgi:hypothetical protein
MATNDFLVYATGGGANVVTQATYAADPNTLGGRPSGILPSNIYNKTARQACFVTSCLGGFINNQTGQNVADNGNLTTFVNQLTTAIGNVASANYLVMPQGRLTAVTNTPIINSDQTVTTLFYTAYNGNIVPVWNGSSFIALTFLADLSLALTAGIATASGLYDVFAFNNSGSLQIGIGPVWTTVTAGSSARGSGANTTQLALKNGILTNAVSITLNNGASVFSSIPANQATYLGSLFIDTVAGQVTCNLSYGQNRKFGIWNAYNRQHIIMRCGDTTATWTNNTTLRPINNNSANAVSTFVGLLEEWITVKTLYTVACVASATATNGIGLNSTSTYYSDLEPAIQTSTAAQFNNIQLNADKISLPPSLGLNTLTFLEQAITSTSPVSGTIGKNQLSVEYFG